MKIKVKDVMFTPEIIAHTYGVEAKVSNDNGRPYIMPVRSVNGCRIKQGLMNKQREEKTECLV